jgi:predicted ATPase
MLDRIDIQNFRCLKSVQVPLRPLTVLVGPNDSGKSAFLAAVGGLAGILNPHEVANRWRFDPQIRVSIVGRTAEGQVDVKPQSSADKNALSAAARERLNPTILFHLRSQGVQTQSAGQDDAAGPPQIGTGGENVSTLFDYLLRKDRRRFFAAVDAIKTLVPGVEDVEVATPAPALRRLDLVIEHGLRIHADQASTGIQLLLVFVALAYHPTPPRTILIEEPETGIHPKRLAEVMHLLRDITMGVHGDHPAQVIVTTHSPYLLDLVDPETDQVLIFRRNEEDGSRTAEPADVDRLKLFLDEFMLGEVWYNQGEEGLVAKRR